jgi:hypothetical protein
LELLQQNNITASEVAFKVGFDSPAYFNKCFQGVLWLPARGGKKKMEEGTLPLAEEKPNHKCKPSRNYPLIQSLAGYQNLTGLLAFAGLALLILALGIVFLTKKGTLIYLPGGQEKSIAVLPFKNLSGRPTTSILPMALPRTFSTTCSASATCG